MRALWNGSISFGLVNIPVHMYMASHDQELKFVMLHKKDLSEIRYARICKHEEKEVPWQEIVKGYEYKKGEFVILDEKDFARASLEKAKAIEIIQFINEDEIDSVYYIKPYYLEPGKNASSAYGLLREALKKSKKVGLARYVLRNREHLAVIKPYNNAIVLIELRFYSELLPPKDLDLPATGKVNTKEMDMALKLINQLTSSFNPKDYKDTYVEDMKTIIQQKAKGRHPAHPKTAEPKPTKVHDIMSLLEASLKKKKSSKKAHKAA